MVYDQCPQRFLTFYHSYQGEPRFSSTKTDLSRTAWFVC